MGLPERKKLKYALDSDLMIIHVKHRELLMWVSKSSGREIPIAEMDTNYIKNAINRVKQDYDINRMNLIEDLKVELIYRSLVDKKENNNKKNNNNGKQQRDFYTRYGHDGYAASV